MHETTTTHARNKTKHRPYLQPRKEGQTQHAEEEPATTAGICKKPYENTRKNTSLNEYSLKPSWAIVKPQKPEPWITLQR